MRCSTFIPRKGIRAGGRTFRSASFVRLAMRNLSFAGVRVSEAIEDAKTDASMVYTGNEAANLVTRGYTRRSRDSPTAIAVQIEVFVSTYMHSVRNG